MLLKDFNFKKLSSKEFKEDSVREEIIIPILEYFNWGKDNNKEIKRSLKLKNPIIKIGNQQKEVNIYPDYVLYYNGKPIFVLDAKAPNQDIEAGKNVEQVYYYAIHQEIQCRFYGLCNGFNFTIFELSTLTPKLNINLQNLTQTDIDNFALFLGEIKEDTTNIINNDDFDYLNCKIPEPLVKIKKRAKKRHFGVHAYFTKQSWDVLQNHIKAFSKPGDVVLDSFGGGAQPQLKPLC
jgi:hypothetical protein